MVLKSIDRGPVAGRVVLAQRDAVARDVRDAVLRRAGYRVVACQDPLSAAPLLDARTADAGVVGLHDRAALDAGCDSLVRASEVPLVVVAHDPPTEAVVDLLHAGADDVVREPVPGPELVARLGALLRREPVTARPAGIRAGDVTIDIDTKRVYLQSEEVELTAIERSLLLVLAREPRTVFARERLMEEVWGLGCLESSSCLTQTVKRLRRKLGCGSDGAIVTVRGWGYRLGDADGPRS